MTLGMVYTRLRAEERLLLDTAEEMGIEVEPIWDEELVLDIHQAPIWADEIDQVLVRTLSLNRSLVVTRALERHGIRCINPHEVLAACGDKWATSLALAEHGVPTPTTRLATTSDGALAAADELGYPVVTKPLQGSWARMVNRLSDQDALEAVVEQREVLGHPLHHQHYLQAFVDKPGRDIRAFVVGDETVAAIHRVSEHWLTNTARGATAENRPVTGELDEVCRLAAHAVGGGPGTVLAVDLMESPDGLVVHEVNATMEFRNSIEPTGVDLPRRVLEHITQAPEVLV